MRFNLQPYVEIFSAYHSAYFETLGKNESLWKYSEERWQMLHKWLQIKFYLIILKLVLLTVKKDENFQIKYGHLRKT